MDANTDGRGIGPVPNELRVLGTPDTGLMCIGLVVAAASRRVGLSALRT